MNKIILIDGTGLVYRSFYAVPPFLKSSSGEPTNAVLGFTNILLNILETQKPDYIAVAFDLRGPTFRHKKFVEYKATRVKAPQELYDQIPKAKTVVEAFEIPVLEAEGYEADDILATLARRFEKEPNCEIYIATGDFDMFQTVNSKVKILYPTKGFKDAEIFTEEAVEKKYGLKPNQIPDYKGLAGDTSDNLPGVRGIGEKTATSLLQKFETLENIYKNLNDISSDSVRQKLEQGQTSAFMSRDLATLVYQTPISTQLEECRRRNFNPQKIAPLFETLGFKKLLDRLKPSFPKQQETLF